MTSSKVSNELIYDLLKQQREDFQDFKQDMREFKRETSHQLGALNTRLHHVEDKIDGIRITWSTRLVSSILATSAVTSAIVAYFITSIS